jgi:hypothetical protein
VARESRRELAAASAAREPQVDGVGSVVDQANNEYFQAFQGCAEQRRDATLASAAPDLEALRVEAAIADPALPDAEAFRPYFVRQQSIGRRCAAELVLALFGAPNGAGERAAAEVASRWREAGKEARVWRPKSIGDLNDILIGGAK